MDKKKIDEIKKMEIIGKEIQKQINKAKEKEKQKKKESENKKN